MLKKGNGLDCLKVQILNGKLQVETNTEFSFNRNIHRLSAFKLTIWNDTSFPLLCKIHMRLKTRPFVSSLLYPATGFICACLLFSHVAGHPQEKKIQNAILPSYIDLHVGVESKHCFLFHCHLWYTGFKREQLL